MKTILFLHGFFASGSCIPANALKEAFEGKVRVLSPDLPLHPYEALDFIRDICRKEMPDMLVGNSCGAFLAQMTANEMSLPALLGNPHFAMTEFLTPRIGSHEYKAPRKNGKQGFTIDTGLIDEFARLQMIQFCNVNAAIKDKVWGLFGEHDTLAHYEPVFRQHYPTVFHFPGNHTPTAEEVKMWYVPLIEKMMATYCGYDTH